ncbi:D-tyrosyl-tRNA(Tyr) deacylase [Alloscardovia theropitheci]|uniref:D-aminoacyl-tRNA deacylase n=1 Tax=Alloscardovia theropitheci TaxID=2496842 RepID=A0A4R0QRM2_9BIFI|nr:D-aminoacyl-tRNA deacylase [Alloscardovia theropitheci]TCD54018.1 D-tyrosyl-tRNA(Tyr) deacylase [Alloscardovia theropitheci]
MRVILQKVSEASISIEPDETIPESMTFNTLPVSERSISHGYVLLVAIHDSDTEKEVTWAAKKIAHMRIFEDTDNKMNLSLLDVHGSILSVSQFTLYANIRSGNRPGFSDAGSPDFARSMWLKFNDVLRSQYGIDVKAGIFGTHMNVSLTNDGPVTIIVDSEIMHSPRRS